MPGSGSNDSQVEPTGLPKEECVVPSGAIDAFRESKNSDESRHNLSKYFSLRNVDDQAMIQRGALFHLHGGTRGNLVRISSLEKGGVQLGKPLSGNLYKDVVPVSYFMTTWSKGQTHLLNPKTGAIQSNRRGHSRVSQC